MKKTKTVLIYLEDFGWRALPLSALLKGDEFKFSTYSDIKTCTKNPYRVPDGEWTVSYTSANDKPTTRKYIFWGSIWVSAIITGWIAGTIITLLL